MRRRFFVQQFSGDRAVMDGESAHHVGRVLRAQPGQVYELSDGACVRLGRVENVTRDELSSCCWKKFLRISPLFTSRCCSPL